MACTNRLGFITLVFASATLMFAGCEQVDSLHGSVTYNGTPVEKGSILFMSADGNGSGFGAQVVDGNYIAEKIELGKHIAIVRGLEKPQVLSKEQSIEKRKSNPHNLTDDYIPESAQGNGQTVDIEGGDQTLDFKIEGPLHTT